MPTGDPRPTDVGMVNLHISAGDHATLAVVGHGTQTRTDLIPHADESAQAIGDAWALGRRQSLAPPFGRLSDRLPVRGHAHLREHLGQVLTNAVEPQVHVLHGLGGSGKTTLALDIARQAKRQQIPVWWIPASDTSALATGLQAVATQLNAGDEELQRRYPADVLWERLTALPGGWLLVIDSADDPSALVDSPDSQADGRGWVRPETGSGTILITSRIGGPRWGDWCTLHPVGRLTRVEGGQLLLDRTGTCPGTRSEAEDLADELGGHPHSLHLAAGALSDNAEDIFSDDDALTTFVGYRRAVRSDALIPQDDELRAWHLAVRVLRARGHERGLTLLALLATYAPTPVPARLLLEAALIERSQVFGPIRARELSPVIRTLRDLHLLDQQEINDPRPIGDYALAVPDLGPETLLILHPLIRTAARLHVQAHPQHAAAILALAVDLAHHAITVKIGAPDEILTWTPMQRAVPHAMHLIDTLADAHPHAPHTDLLPRAIHTGNIAARSLFAQGLYDQANRHLTRLRDLAHRALGPRHEETLRARHYLAVGHQARDEYHQALHEHDAVLQLRREVLGPDDPETLRSRHYRALTLHALARLDRAETEYAAVLKDRRRIIGTEHPHTLSSEHGLARILHDRGHLEEAEKAYRTLHRRMRRALGPDYRHTLATQHNLALVLHAQGRLDEAEATYRVVAEAESRLSGPEHPNSLASRYNLARVRLDRGADPQAGAERSQVLRAQIRVLGPDHADTVATREGRPGPSRPGPL